MKNPGERPPQGKVRGEGEPSPRDEEVSGEEDLTSRLRRDRLAAEDRWRSKGNLSEAEVIELIGYLEEGTSSVGQQIRNDYLRLRAEDPEVAERMLSEIGEVGADDTLREADVIRLCTIVQKYHPGRHCTIKHKNEIYSHEGKEPRSPWDEEDFFITEK